MRTRFIVYSVLATLGIGGIAFAADAFFVSDVERVEQLGDELASAPEPSETLLRWVDVSRQPVMVTRGGQSMRFEDEADYALADELADALAPFAAEDLEVVQRTTQVETDRATLA